MKSEEQLKKFLKLKNTFFFQVDPNQVFIGSLMTAMFKVRRPVVSPAAALKIQMAELVELVHLIEF